MNEALLTDFYQLTMAHGYWRLGIHEQEAVFHLFCRKNPVFSNYIVASGTDALIDFLNNFYFSEEDIDYLRAHFPEDFLSYLKTMKFTGDIDAVPEGELIFPGEPMLRIKAPLIQAQLLETIIINTFNFASGVATMASQMRSVAGDDLLFEFGLRRAQGPNGGLLASRSAYLGGFDATSNVLAGKEFGVPMVGTMAHSWVMAFEDELQAFEAYANVAPDNIIFLVDTYDTITGVKKAIAVGKKLKSKGAVLKGIRLDSGDMVSLSKQARQLLDQAGFHDTKIYASGEITLAKLKNFKQQSAMIDGWGVGTRLVTLYEQPALDIAYKLGAIKAGDEWQYKLKVSEDRVKTSDPGILQIRRYKKDGKLLGDLVYHQLFGVENTNHPGADFEDVLKPIFRSGLCVAEKVSLDYSREFCIKHVAGFQQTNIDTYAVSHEERLHALKKQLMGE